MSRSSIISRFSENWRFSSASKASFWEFLDKRLKHQEDKIPWFVNDKLKANEFLRNNNIPTPNILEVYDKPGDIKLSNLPNSFCLKPSNMHSAAGVLPLLRLTADRFFDRLRKRVISADAIIREQEVVFEKSNFKSSYKLMVEEGLGHPRNDILIPFDYKIYAFKQGIGLIYQVDRNSDRSYISFLSETFAPISSESVINLRDGSVVRLGQPVTPKYASEMLECAKLIPGLLDTPFMRVDMYSTKKGFFVGELTPAPGPEYYKDWFEYLPDCDTMLGNLWANSVK